MKRAYRNTSRKAFRMGYIGSLLNYLRSFLAYKTRVEDDSGTVEDDAFSKSVYKMLDKYDLETGMKLSVIAEGGLKTRISGVEKYVTKAYDLSESNNDATQTTESSQPFLGGRIAPNEIQNFKSVTGVTKTLTHADIVVSGTYTIIKVLNAEDSGKTVVSFTEVGTGTYNSITWTGRLYGYMIYGGTISAANQALIETDLLNLVEAVESVTIGTQEWATSNLEMVATPEGNVIPNVTEAANVEKVTGGNFESGLVGSILSGDETSTWTLNTTTPIAGTQDGLLEVTSIGVFSRPLILIENNSFNAVAGRWYKAVFSYKVNSGTVVLSRLFLGGINAFSLGITLSGEGTFSQYRKAPNTISNSYFGINISGANIFNIQLDNVSVEEVGWSDLGNLFTDLTTNQGYTDYEAYKECSAWCYYNNDSEIGSVYGKLYNWYAAALLDADMLSAGFGWRVPTQAQFETLATALGGTSVAGGKMKVAGTDYWLSPNTGADNSSGFSVLPSGRRSSAGAFISVKSRSDVYVITEYNSTIGYTYYIDNDVASISNTTILKETGNSIRLIKE